MPAHVLSVDLKMPLEHRAEGHESVRKRPHALRVIFFNRPLRRPDGLREDWKRAREKARFILTK
jgi:hypothetical protein